MKNAQSIAVMTAVVIAGLVSVTTASARVSLSELQAVTEDLTARVETLENETLVSNVYELSDVINLSSPGTVFPSSSSPRLVEGFHLSTSNNGAGVCFTSAGLVFSFQSGSNFRNMAQLSVPPGGSEQVFVTLPRPVIVRPNAIPRAEFIVTNVIFQEGFLSGSDCSRSLTVFSRPAP